MPFVKIERKQKNQQQHCSSQQNISKLYFINDLQKTLDRR